MDKRYLSRVLLYVLLAIFGLALILEMGYQFYDSVYESVEAIDPKLKSVDIGTSTQGFIVMGGESPLYSEDKDGICRYLVSDGEKVSRGQTVAKVYTEASGIMNRITELESEIDILTRAQTLASAYSPSSVESELSTLRARIAALSEQGAYSEMKETEDELRLMLAISQIAKGQVASYSERIAALRSDLSEQNAALSVGSAVKIENSGYFYSTYDGYESLIDYEHISSLTTAELLSVFDAEPTSAPDGSQGIGKLVTAFEWQLVCELDADAVNNYVEGASYNVRFDTQSAEITMKLIRLSIDKETSRVAALFKADRFPIGFKFTRIQPITVIRETVSGYEVPAGALRYVDGVPGVYVLHGSVVQYREVRTVYQDNGYAFSLAQFESDSDVKALSRYDRIIVKGKDLYVGKIIG